MLDIHISTAVRMLESPEPVSLTVITANAEIRHFNRCVGLKRQHYAGTRNIKILPDDPSAPIPPGPPDIRKIRDSLIIAVNGLEVFI